MNNAGGTMKAITDEVHRRQGGSAHHLRGWLPRKRISRVATVAAVLLAGCGSSPSHAEHHAAVATVAPTTPAPTTPAPTQPAINTAQEAGTCKYVKSWLPRAWSQDPPTFTNRLALAAGNPALGALETDLSNLQTDVQILSAGQYMGTSTDLSAVERDCAAVGVKVKTPGYSPMARCWRRVRAWKDGPVKDELGSMSNALSSFNKYSNSNIYVAVVFLHIAATAAGLAQTWPIPACADPGGYWRKWLRNEQRMGTDVGSPAVAAAAGYLPNAAISDQQRAESDFHSVLSELKNTTGHRPFG
jgi:hypothetical protein